MNKKIIFAIIKKQTAKKGNAMPIITAENLTFKYKDAPSYALKGVSFSVEKGEFVTVLGHNGSGKSTLAKLLNGLLTAESGNLLIDGLSVSDKKSVNEIRKKVGVVFQNPDNQLVASIVEDDIVFGPENLRLDRTEIGKRLEFALNAVGMQEYRKSTPTRLSGGQKQRIAIAGVLAVLPQILVLDESTAMLDPEGREEVMKVVKDLNDGGMTVINITHYMEEAVNSDKIIVLCDGEIALVGTPKEIFSKRKELEKLNLTVPTPKKIADSLIEKGINLPSDIFTKERLASELEKLFATGVKNENNG